MTTLIFVGYRTLALPGCETLMPEFTGRAGTKDPEKIAEQIAEKKAEWLANAANQPYTGTLSEVTLLVPSLKKAVTYKSEGRGGDTGKPAVCVAVRDFLLKTFPKAWPNAVFHHEPGDPVAAFVGFEPKLFLKMLGIECTLPVNNSPLPVALWHGNTDHRDIAKVVMPDEFKGLDWPLVIKSRRVGLTDKDQVVYDAMFKDWTGPGNNSELDAKIAWVLSGQVGFAPKEAAVEKKEVVAAK